MPHLQQSVRLWQHARSEFDTFRAELESPGISPTPEQEAHLVELQHRLDKVYKGESLDKIDQGKTHNWR